MTSQFKPTLYTFEERLPPAALSASVIVSHMNSINLGVILPSGGTTVPPLPPSPPTVPPPPPPTGGM